MTTCTRQGEYYLLRGSSGDIVCSKSGGCSLSRRVPMFVMNACSAAGLWKEYMAVFGGGDDMMWRGIVRAVRALGALGAVEAESEVNSQVASVLVGVV